MTDCRRHHRTCTSPSRKRFAFTLVEMLVALTIGSLLVLATVSATRATVTSRESIERQIDRQSAARHAMEAIVAALRNVRRDPIQEQPVLTGVSGGARGDRIDLLVVSDRKVRPDAPESDQYEMSFTLGQVGDAPLPALLCRKDHALDDTPDDGGILTIVAEGIVGLEFMYLTEEEWVQDWPPDEKKPPEAVRVTVVAMDVDPGERGPSSARTILSTIVPISVMQEASERPGNPPNPEGGPR